MKVDISGYIVTSDSSYTSWLMCQIYATHQLTRDGKDYEDFVFRTEMIQPETTRDPNRQAGRLDDVVHLM